MDNQNSMGSQRTLKTPGGGEYRSMGDSPTLRGAATGRRVHSGDVLLGRYRIVSELGQGGMGVVYRCFDGVGGIEVALKALPPELSHNSIEMEEVRENFRLVEGLHHPNIAAAKTLERDEATGDTYLVMECVEGVNLRQWRKAEGRRQEPGGRSQSGAVSLEKVLPVLRQIASALDFAHSQKIIHRDIKSANVMIRADGAVKVLDFGLAAQIQTSLSRVTRVHYGTSGTGPYMAPEQWRGQRQDARTDQYALAVMAYELLSGGLPFENPDAAVLREAVLKEPPTEIPGLDKKVWQALSRAMAKEPSQRFPCCGAFVEALSGRGQGAGAGSRPWLLLAAAGVAVTGIAYIGYEAYQERQKKIEQERAARARDVAFIAATNDAETVFQSAGWDGGTSRLERVRAMGLLGEKTAEELSARWQACVLSGEVARVCAAALAVDPGQGFEPKLGKLRSAWKAADQALGERANKRASSLYGEAREGADELLQLDVKRRAAAAAMGAAGGVKAKAEGANVKALAGPAWQAAERGEEKARQMFEAGNFELARNEWHGLSNTWGQLQAQVESQVAAYGRAKKMYEDAVKAVSVPAGVRAAGKTGPVSDEELRDYLGRYGGSAWTLAAQHEKEAQASLNTAEGAAAFENAAESLKVACSDAAKAANDHLLKAQADQEAAASKRKEDAVARRPRLNVSVSAEGRTLEGASVTLDGHAQRWAAPCALDLEPGREHRIAVSRVPDGTTTYVPADFAVKASWEGERDTNFVLSVKRQPDVVPPPARMAVPEPAAAKPEPDVDRRQYFMGRALSRQPTTDSMLFKPSQGRFRVGAKGRVADSQLRKTWVLYDPKEVLTFKEARQRAESLGGRLPTKQELSSLLTLNREQGDWARLNGQYFPKHERSEAFWSEDDSVLGKISNGLMTSGSLMWRLDFSDGTVSTRSSDDQYGVLVIQDGE